MSREETYADITPVRLDTNGVSAFISIMRGCDNMCSFCVVPFTRGRERSRDPESIINECRSAYENGYREVTLLGQNVDSYKCIIGADTIYFSDLLDRLATQLPQLWIRFSTSHPKDMTDAVLKVMAQHHNICKYIHLPVQSGSNSVLQKMNRGYTREWYLDRIAAINRIIPDCGISMDIITGVPPRNTAERSAAIGTSSDANPWATAGLVIGIVSVFLYELAALPLAGIVVSGIGVSIARRPGGRGLSKAMWGLGLSVLFLFVSYAKRMG